MRHSNSGQPGHLQYDSYFCLGGRVRECWTKFGGGNRDNYNTVCHLCVGKRFEANVVLTLMWDTLGLQRLVILECS